MDISSDKDWQAFCEATEGHTPGPWHSDEADMFGDYTITQVGEISAVAAVISNCRPAEEVAANAALVDAAPAMKAEIERLRAALQVIASRKWDSMTDGCNAAVEAKDIARTALTGEA